MGKLMTYVIMISGLMVLFYLTGLLTECCGVDGICGNGDDDTLCSSSTASSYILDFAFNVENQQTTTTATDVDDIDEKERNILLAVLVGIGGIGAVAAIKTGWWQPDTTLIFNAAVGAVLFIFLWDAIAIFVKFREQQPELALLIFVPAMLLFIVTIYEWVRGRD